MKLKTVELFSFSLYNQKLARNFANALHWKSKIFIMISKHTN